MIIYLNAKEFHFEDSKSLFQVFIHLNIDVSAGVAAAVNEVVIPKSQWNIYKLNDLDKIILIKASQGG